MKVIAASFGTPGTIRSVRVSGDSTILRTGDPLFIADHLGEWTAEICPAVRLSRLGTNIPRKVAGRYFDSAALVLIVSPADPSAHPEGICGLLDRSVAPGEWLGEEVLSDGPTEISLYGPSGDSSVEISGLRSLFEDSVHELSRYCTFKTGDLLLLRGLGPSPADTLRPDTTINACLDGRQALRVRFK